MDDNLNPLLWGAIDRKAAERVANTQPKFKVGDIVDVNSWVGTKYGFEVIDVKVTYHNRMEEYVWGYDVYKEGESSGFSFVYIPEGYLSKHTEQTDASS